MTLTNDGQIQGQGVIGNGGLALFNAGGATINSNVSGAALELNGSGGTTNSGLLEATGGGVLNIDGVTVGNTGANITAGSGSTVQVTNSEIVGGTLNNNGGTLETIGNSILNGTTTDGLTINGAYTAGPNTQTHVLGTITNGGSMQITGGNNSNAYLILDANTTLQGTGMVTLAYNGSGVGAGYIQQNIGGLTLTNETTIQGAGVIGNGGLTVINAAGATIDANVSAQTLTVNPSGGFTNTGGLLEASNGGILSLSSSVIDNQGGTIEVNGATSQVQLVAGVTIQGGTLTSVNSGSLGVPGASITLDGSTKGALTLSTGTTFTAGPGTDTNVLGTIVNNGNMQLTGGSNSNAYLILDESTTLQGNGTITLAYNGSGAGAAYIQQNTGGLTLTNEGTIQGQGVIGNGGLTVINAVGATIDADVATQTLTVNPSGGFTNTGGLLEASNGGILSLSSAVINNQGGTIEVDGASSQVQLVNGVTIQGGTLTSVHGGSLGVPGTSITLDGTTQGALTLSTGTTFTAGPSTQTNVFGTIINNGSIQLTGGSNANALLNLTADTTLQGNGTITLAYNGSGAGAAIIQQNTGGLTLTNETTIQGQGVIGNGGLTVINAAGATIDANVATQTLTVNPSGGFTNTGGLLEASNGGILSLSSAVINNQGGTIEVDGASSQVQLVNGVTIQGGTLTSVHGGSLGVPGTSITLDGTTQGALTLSTGTTFTAGPSTQTNVFGTIINNGNIQLTGGSNANALLNLTADTTLQGTGTVTLAYNGSGSGAAYIQQSTGGLTLTNESTIQGAGVIGNGGDLTFVNSSSGTLLANTAGQTLTVNGTGGFTTSGSVTVSGNSTLDVSGTAYQQTGGQTVIESGGTLDAPVVDIQGGTMQVDGTLDPASIEIFASATLDGTETLGTLSDLATVQDDVGGTVVLGDSSADALGTLTVDGDYTQYGTLDYAIQGASATGLLDVTGNVTIDAAMFDIELDPLGGGFSPTNGELFNLIDYGTLTVIGTSGFEGSDAATGAWWTTPRTTSCSSN